MTHAIRVHEAGGPEVLRWEAVEVGAPGPGEIRLRHLATGVNFIDCYFRQGLYPAAGGFPFVPGAEGAGVVEAVGEGVTTVAPGDRVVYQTHLGSYSEARILPAERAVKLPDGIDPKVAAAAFLKGLTVQCLIRRTFKVEAGQTILWHAVAGGVGLIAAQWVTALGATLIGTVGDDAKAETAKAAGCTHVINYRTEDFVSRVKEITNGEGADCVYDSVGKDTFPASLDCLRPLGMFASFGQSSACRRPSPWRRCSRRGAVRDAPDDHDLPRQAPGPRTFRGRTVRGARRRNGEDGNQPGVASPRGGRGPPGARGPQDDRRHRPHSLAIARGRGIVPKISV
jgi:NADPH2:quinone reductase